MSLHRGFDSRKTKIFDSDIIHSVVHCVILVVEDLIVVRQLDLLIGIFPIMLVGLLSFNCHYLEDPK
jgi:hypothetical protein